MEKLNCWEFKKCGREPGGLRLDVAEDPCPASLIGKCDGLNDGKNGGRVCWAVVGTMCTEKSHLEFANNLGDCLNCDFYKLVRKQQNYNFHMHPFFGLFED